MKKNCFVFCHGFGLDASFWRNLLPFFKEEKVIVWDLGYFGEIYCPYEDANDHYIGIGHSLGLIKLLSSPFPFKHLIGLNGFIHFLGNNPLYYERRQREWLTLKNQFKRAPSRTLQQFYARAEIPFAPPLQTIQTDRLENDLNLLAENVSHFPNIPTLILGSQNDLIVPAPIIEDNFAHLTQVSYKMANKGSHALGYLEAKWVFHSIKTFIKQSEQYMIK